MLTYLNIFPFSLFVSLFLRLLLGVEGRGGNEEEVRGGREEREEREREKTEENQDGKEMEKGHFENSSVHLS